MIYDWGKLNGLEFNPSKTCYVPMSSKLKKSSTQITMNLQKIEPTDTVKILGVYIDSGLTFKTHIEKVIEKADRTFCFISRISSKIWGASPEVLKLL